VGDRAGGGDAANPGLKILYLNSQSIVNKVNELACLASDVKPDIILITESWCNNSISNAYLSLTGYQIKI